MLRHGQAEASAGVRGVVVAAIGAGQLFLITQTARGRRGNEYHLARASRSGLAYGKRNASADAERRRELGGSAAASTVVFGARAERGLSGTCGGQNVRRVRRLSMPRKTIL